MNSAPKKNRQNVPDLHEYEIDDDDDDDEGIDFSKKMIADNEEDKEEAIDEVD
eukprot:CAMPEP_0114600520 /NCGR_PEP_ID=MMETSP0125-20121206/23115_1 /TAXON_ID=485358 ORGANISM="Aristerostoma sp., Strain ATCC 50986" /NCGR_SAMPLE_ID=MMETSP0125 /ASSEMBLY_ACC=CAM_ASM_000245 /LENGTH=52 /DNA_ID=CAMNT_0001808783 /DNA_START=28 /DNA_END=183 /DNA_ORIENTATION=+